MRFFTGVFGESHRRSGLGLVRSFMRCASHHSLTVFTDLPGVFPNEQLRDFQELIASVPAFYDRPGGRRNVFKYRLFGQMQEMFPGETTVWLDADLLVLDDLATHLAGGKVNVIAHGRRGGQTMACGNGLEVPGDRYVISGMFSLPPGPALAYLERVIRNAPAGRMMGTPTT